MGRLGEAIGRDEPEALVSTSFSVKLQLSARGSTRRRDQSPPL